METLSADHGLPLKPFRTRLKPQGLTGHATQGLPTLVSIATKLCVPASVVTIATQAEPGALRIKASSGGITARGQIH